MSSEPRPRVGILAGLGLVAVVGLIAWLYAPILGYGFVKFDDDVNIYGNPHIGEITWERVRWAWTGFDYLPRVMPLAWLTIMGIFEVAGMDPAAYHAFNLAMHLANTALVYGVAELALRLAARSRGETPQAGWCAALALLAAAAWGLHPLRSESIAWTTGWNYQLVTFFALVSAGLALRRLETTGAWRRVLYAGAVGAFVVSGLVYPVALGFPAALLAFEWWLGRGRAAAGAGFDMGGRLVRAHLVFFAVAGTLLAFNVWARLMRNEFYPPAPSPTAFTPENRVAQAVMTVPYYAVRMTWAGETSPVKDLRAPAKLLDWPVAGVAAALLAAVAGACWCFRTSPGWMAAGFAFAGVAGPVSGLLDYPFQACDRYGYLLGIVLMLSIALALRRMRPGMARRLLAAGLVLWTGWLAVSVPRQLPKWADSEALLGHLLATLEKPEGREAYGQSLAIYRAQRGDFEAARALLTELEAQGGDADSLANRRERVDSLERMARTPTIIPARRGWVAPEAMLSHLFAVRDFKAGELRGAVFRYRQALAADPDFHDARYNFALLLVSRGAVAEAWREYEELRRRAGAGLPEAADKKLRSVIEGAAAITGRRLGSAGDDQRGAAP